MTTTPLPQMPDPYQEVLTPFWAYTADQMQAYAQQARANLEAENQRLREALEKAVDQAIWPSESISNALAEARAVLEKQS